MNCKIVLELSCPFFGPAFDDHFFLREELDRVHALPVHVAEEGVFPAAEGEECHRRGDPNAAQRELRAALMRAAQSHQKEVRSRWKG